MIRSVSLVSAMIPEPDVQIPLPADHGPLSFGYSIKFDLEIRSDGQPRWGGGKPPGHGVWSPKTPPVAVKNTVRIDSIDFFDQGE